MPKTTTDHDLLIRLDEKVDGLLSVISELKDDVSKNKADKEVLAETNKTVENHEKRIRSLERFSYLLLGAMILLNILIPLAVDYLKS